MPTLDKRPKNTTMALLTFDRWLLLLVSLLLILDPFVISQECTADGENCDSHERCTAWATEGECIRNHKYMQEHCPAACANQKESVCADAHPHCSRWAELGECSENRAEMHRYCQESCGVCDVPMEEASDVDPECKNEHELCDFWAESGECQANPTYMHVGCALACGTCNKVASSSNRVLVDVDETILEQTAEFGEKQRAEGAQASETLEVVRKSIEYRTTQDFVTLPQKIKKNCLNRNDLCAFWAVIGECENNRAYMQTNCAPSCRSCHMIDIEARCPKLQDPKPALYPGDLNVMFERIVRQAPGNKTDLTDEELEELASTNTPLYTVTIHSRPPAGATEISAALDKSTPPWIVTFDNFITDEECDAMVALGYEYEYKRSEDVGAPKFDGTHDSVKSERRTSENAWCSDFAGCRGKEVPQILHDRMARAMGIPAVNSEDLQLLKYEVGQFYRTHHDYIPHQVNRHCGPRILTFFLYLSDVEQGGGTDFPQLDITVEPKKGRALLWPSVLNSDPMAKDNRMYHQALEVKGGTKFAANGWIHMYDYVTPQKNGCN